LSKDLLANCTGLLLIDNPIIP